MKKQYLRLSLIAVSIVIIVLTPIERPVIAQETEKRMSPQLEKVVYIINFIWFKPERGVEKYTSYANAVTPLIEKTWWSSLARPAASANSPRSL